MPTIPQTQRIPSDKDSQSSTLAKKRAEHVPILLLRQNARRLRQIVRRTLAANLRGILDPEDILQEIALVLLTKALPEWVCTPMDFTRYVGAIARNLARAYNRRHLNGRHHTRHDEVPLTSVPEDDAPSFLEPHSVFLVQEKETQADVLDWLPLSLQGIVIWILRGYSVAEVALAFDIDEDTVISFVCTANNDRPHAEQRIAKDEALRLFKPRRHRGREKSGAKYITDATRRLVAKH